MAKERLPAVAAISAIASIAAASTTSAAATTIATAPSATTASAIASAAATTATAAFGLRTRFVHYQVPATKILTIEVGNRAIRFFIVGNFDEGESPRLSRESIPNQVDCGRVHANLSEPFLQLFFGCREWKITDVKLLHLRTPSARNLTTIAER